MKNKKAFYLFTVLAASVLLLAAVNVQALDKMPPLPNECREAKETADPQAKVSLYTRCLEYGKFYAEYQRNEMYFYRANALFELRRYAEALADYNRFIPTTGGHVWAMHQRGLTHWAMGHRQLAVADFDKALESNSDAIAVLFDRGQLLEEMGLYQPALKDLRRAETLAAEYYSSSHAAANALAWLLATCPDAKIRDGQEAVRLALKAVSIDRNAQNLDTLAAAQARKGDFKQAVETQQAALALLTKYKAVQAEIQEFTTRLSLYKVGKAYTQHRPE
jgi:tetratricopeptide (TPR) repeat protein